MKKELALEMKGIAKSFTGVKVLHEVDLQVEKGEIHGLVGENGAGKSTMMNIIGGIIDWDAGTMKVDGQLYHPKSPLSAADAGIAFIHQELNLFTNLTVAENMFIEIFPKKLKAAIDYKKIMKLAQDCIDEYDLPVKPTDKVEILPAGVRQMVEISKGLMKNAKIMIFDEPTTSLSHREKAKLFATLNDLKNKGITIIYISHILEDVFHLCDRITVLRDGHIIGTNKTKQITNNEIIKMMVGREINQVYPKIEKEIKDNVVLDVRNIQYKNRVNDVSLSINEGEIVGIYGLMGAGRTELVKAVFGAEPMDKGEVYVEGKKIETVSPQECIKNHIALVTEDRHHEGLLMKKTVKDNLILVKLVDILKKFSVVDRAKESEFSNEVVKSLRIKVTDPAQQNANGLSGGNQQKVVFGKWVIKNPRVFILDEPTRGVDVGAKFEIYTIIANMAKNGSSILLVSSEMEELMGTCDRILVMREGSIVGELQKSDFDQETIAKLAR